MLVAVVSHTLLNFLVVVPLVEDICNRKELFGTDLCITICKIRVFGNNIYIYNIVLSVLGLCNVTDKWDG